MSPGASGVRRSFYRLLPPPAQQWIATRWIDRFDRGALRRFQRAHASRPRAERGPVGDAAIVVPCWNHAPYLDAMLESVAAQSYRPFELILVEDRSADDTWARLEKARGALPAGIRVTLLRNPRNLGQAASINRGVEGSAASVFMILNDDDYLAHDALEAAIELLRREEDLYLLGATSVHFTGTGPPAADDPRLFIRNRYADYGRIPLRRCRPEDVRGFRRANDLNMTHSGSVFFRSAWSAVGGYQPEKSRRVIAYSDRDFQLRVASLFPVAVSMKAPFSFWRSDSSVDRGANT